MIFSTVCLKMVLIMLTLLTVVHVYQRNTSLVYQQKYMEQFS